MTGILLGIGIPLFLSVGRAAQMAEHSGGSVPKMAMALGLIALAGWGAYTIMTTVDE